MPGILLCLFISLLFNFSAFALSGKTITDPPADKIFIPLSGAATPISLADFVKLDTKSFKRHVGKKLSFVEKISFKINQLRFRKCIRKNGTVNLLQIEKISKEPFRFSIGGFMLGFWLWLPGLIISLFVDDKKKRRDRFLSALMGFFITSLVLIYLANNIGFGAF